MYIGKGQEILALREIADRLEEQNKEHQNQLDEKLLQFKTLIEYPKGYKDLFVNSFVSDSVEFNHYVNTILGQLKPKWSDPSVADYERYIPLICEKLKPLFDLVKQNDKDNEKIHTHNTNVISNVEKNMALLGINKTYKKYTTKGRQRNPKWHEFVSGFVDDLERARPKLKSRIIMFDKFKTFEEVEKAVTDKINKIIKPLKEKEQAEARKEEQARKEKENMMFLLKFSEKYCDGDIDATPDTILDNILDKDKYLRLAHYLYLNRSNYNSGYDYAEAGLNGFNEETDEDTKICDAIQKILDNEDVDGRYFRDMDYGYDYLFDKADNELLKDYNELIERYSCLEEG